MKKLMSVSYVSISTALTVMGAIAPVSACVLAYDAYSGGTIVGSIAHKELIAEEPVVSTIEYSVEESVVDEYVLFEESAPATVDTQEVYYEVASFTEPVYAEEPAPVTEVYYEEVTFTEVPAEVAEEVHIQEVVVTHEVVTEVPTVVEPTVVQTEVVETVTSKTEPEPVVSAEAPIQMVEEISFEEVIEFTGIDGGMPVFE